MSKLKSFFLGAAAAVLVFAGVGSAQVISEVSGNGQLICPLCPFGVGTFQPMVVIVKDATGNPLPNQTVTWTLISGNGQINTTQTVTATSGVLADGVTSAVGTTSNFLVLSVPLISSFGQAYTQGVVTASIGASSVNFTETQGLTAQGGVKLISSSLLSPPQGQTFTGPAGGPVGTPVTIQATSLYGGGVPGIEMKIVATAATAGPNVACQAQQPGLAPNTVLTDTTGTATCNLIFTGTPGSGQFNVVVGGGDAQFPAAGGFNFNVTAGAPGTIKLVTGNNQSANPNSPLPGVLTAEVDDQAGNPLPNIAVLWDVPQGNATLTQTQTTTDSSGRIRTNVTLGTGSAPVQVRVRLASNTAISATFNETVNVVVTGISKISGDVQTAVINTAFAQPLVVQVNNQAQAVPGVTVTFSVTSGSATLGSATATTDANGQASTTVQAGAVTGPAAVTATVGTNSVSFNLTVIPVGPSITSNSFYNAAGLQQGFLSPCSLATIIAPGLAPGIQGAVVPALFGPLPYVLANVSVQFGNSYAPVYSVVNSYSAGMDAVTVQVPCESAPGAVNVTVKVGGGSASVTVQIGTVSPGVFETVMSDNKKRAVLTRPDGSFVELENPARRGEVIRAYVTGLGPVSPAVGTNQYGIPDTDSLVSSTIVVGVNNGGVRVVDAKYAPSMIGVYVVDFQLPSDVAAGSNIPFAVAVQQGNNLVFGNGSLIPIQ